MNLSEVPDITVPLSAGGYIGFTLLGLLGLAILIFGALNFAVHGGLGLAIAGLGTIVFMYAAFSYLRTTEMGWHWPNVLVWAGLLASGLLATIATHYIEEARGSSTGLSAFVPVAGVGLATIIAALFDALNEFLGGVPLTWGAAILIVVAVAAFVFSKAR